MTDVDVVVNCYERTYRHVLSRGFFAALEEQNRRPLHRYALINNVDDRGAAGEMAQQLVDDGELTGFAFVADRLPAALRVAGLPRRALGSRPYFLDYGLVMTITGRSPWLLGWDAEVRLDAPADWLTPAIDLMGRRADVFSAAPRWPSRGVDTLPTERVAGDGCWALNWGFSDQVFLVRRADVAAPIYRRFAPASWARNAEHPWTFEARVEAYQRASRRYRATCEDVSYAHNDLPDVVQRIGGRRTVERVQHAGLSRLRTALRRWPTDNPRWKIR